MHGKCANPYSKWLWIFHLHIGLNGWVDTVGYLFKLRWQDTGMICTIWVLFQHNLTITICWCLFSFLTVCFCQLLMLQAMSILALMQERSTSTQWSGTIIIKCSWYSTSCQIDVPGDWGSSMFRMSQISFRKFLYCHTAMNLKRSKKLHHQRTSKPIKHFAWCWVFCL